MSIAVLAAVFSLAVASGGASQPPSDPRYEAAVAKVEQAINEIQMLDRPARDNLAAAWDGNKYVQCRQMADDTLRCEAAGALMQSSLARVLTPDHVQALGRLGWSLDPSFGNYVQRFDPRTPTEAVARKIVTVLTQVYGVDPQQIDVETTSVASEPCPPRNGPSQNLAGLINDAPSMAKNAVHACAYTPDTEEPAQTLPPGASTADLIKLYGPSVAAEIGRLRVNVHREVFFVLDTEIGYVQCHAETDPDSFFCEAQSTESWPALASVLTPDRIARLHDMGFADPGRSPNYSKTYAVDQIKDDALAAELLTVLHEVYGYYGGSALALKTEETPTEDTSTGEAPQD